MEAAENLQREVEIKLAIFGNVNLEATMRSLESIGFYDVALPFILVFTIIFAVLQKVSIFGTDSKKYNVVIALVAAFLVIRVQSIVGTMNMFLPKVSLFVLVVICLLMVLGLFGLKAEWSGFMLFTAVIVCVLAIIWAFSEAAMPGIPSWIRLSAEDKAVLVGIGVFLLILYFLFREPEGGKGKVMGRIYKGIGDLPGELGRSARP